METALVMHCSHRFFPDVLRLAERLGKVTVFDRDKGEGESEISQRRIDLVLNFLTDEIYKGAVLDLPNINFHPGTPAYRGIGPTSRALFDRLTTFGATAHRMVRSIDAGPIFAIEDVPVRATDSSETLFARVEAACVCLADRITDHIALHGACPPPIPRKWTGDYVSAPQFFKWMELDATDRELFDRKLRATRHSKKHGPYITVHGHRFVLAKS